MSDDSDRVIKNRISCRKIVLRAWLLEKYKK